MKLDHTSVDAYEIELSSDCNAACPLCARTERKFSPFGNSNLSIYDIKNIFPDGTYIENKSFFLSGVFGDPIVNSDCLEICKYFSENGASVIEISTNAGYNTASWWTELSSIKNIRVRFAVDGHEKTNHIYRVNTKWSVIERNIEAYSSGPGRGEWIFLGFDHNDCEYEIAKNHAERLGLDFKRHDSARTKLSKKTSTDRKTGHTVFIQSSKKQTEVNLDDIAKIREYQVSNNVTELKKWTNTIKCKSKERPMLFISSDARLYPCCYLYSDFTIDKNKILTNRFPEDFNDLRIKTVDEILASDFYLELEQMWNPYHSNHLPRCLATCAADGQYSSNRAKKV